MTPATDKERLTDAFKTLRRLGYFARQTWQCCQSCGWSAVPDGKGERAVFYHRQDAEDAFTNAGTLREGIYLAWAGNGYEIVGVLVAAGLRVQWNGSQATRIFVLPAEVK